MNIVGLKTATAIAVGALCASALPAFSQEDAAMLDTEAMSSEEVQMVQEHCAELLAQDAPEQDGDGSSSETDALAEDSMTEAEMAEAGDESESEADDASTGETNSDAAASDGEAELDAGGEDAPALDLSAVTTEDCLRAGIDG